MRTHSRAGGALGLIAVGAAALAGCGGVGVGSTDTARIRVADVATNAATVNVLVNSSAAYGDQINPPAGDVGNFSPYLYAGTGTSTFSYISSAVPGTTPVTTTSTTGVTTTTTTAISNTAPLSSGKFYSAFLIGRADAAVTDPLFLHVIVTDDTHATPAGQASLRIIDAAPDAGALDVLVNGATPDASFSNVTYRTAQNAFYAAPYVTVPAGTLALKLNAAGTQNALSAATTTSITTAAGQAYTLILTEPTAPIVSGGTTTGSLTYALQLIPDDSK